MDRFSKQKRSELMSRIRANGTKPEIRVRKLLHACGYRFRLHCWDLPGRPDIILPKYHTVIFVHGCFWHGHNCPKGKSIPATNTVFWQNKIKTNIERDKRIVNELTLMQWKILVI